MIDWLIYTLLLVVLASGIGVQLFNLPGLWLMAGSTALYAWITQWQFIAGRGIAAVLILCLIAELVEFLAGAGGAKRVGGSKRAMVFSIVGGIAGGLLLTIPLPIIGTIIGVCLGAFAGATLAQMTVKGHIVHSTRVGLGAAKGAFIGIVAKLSVGVVIFIMVAILAIPL